MPSISNTKMETAKSIALVIVTIPLLAALVAWAQGASPPARTKAGSITPGDGMAAVEPTGQASGSIEQQIKTLYERGRQAALKADTSFMEGYLTDDYVGIAADGSLVTKDQNIQMLESGAIKYEAIDERDVKVHVYGDTAIVNALVFVRLTVNGKPISGDHRTTFVWLKRQGNWKEVFFQATRVASRIPRPGDNLGHDARPAPP